ncbi:MAG: VENN motif pre-toxin domain-containing protein, partial [Neisseriaceae bacterium]|nr:VENN motif pre-toxin domain-containing protein [Neisseriaceae bacterium]
AQKLNIESQQNTATYNSNQQYIKGDITIGYGGFSGSVNGGKSKINSNYASVNEQSGIFAGDDGYQINIKDNTHLNGGLITSTANAEQNGKNRFETGTITFKDLANKAEYKGEAFGLGISGSVKGNNPNSNSSIYTVDKTGMSNTMGYGRDKESQSSVTYAGINTANITIRDTAKQQALTGKSAEETIKAVKTNITLENHQNLSGRLNNNFDAKKVQSKVDLQVEVTKEFSNNVRDFQSKQNKRLDELKAKKENGEISQKEYQEQTQKIEQQKLITNVVAGGLLSPADSVLGIATSTLAPAVSHEIGQHFKKEGKEGSFEHIATHAVIGALTSAANGGNALSGAVSAGGAEYIAKVTAQTLFKKDADELTADEKQTVSSIAQLVGVVSGNVTGDSSLDAYVGRTVASSAVENNLLAPSEWNELSHLDELARKNGTLTKAQAERAEYLLNKHGYSEKLLAKYQQDPSSLSQYENEVLDNALIEQTQGDRQSENLLRKTKGSVQGDYRNLKAVVNREIGYSESFQGQMDNSMQYAYSGVVSYYIGGHEFKSFGANVLQTIGQNVLISNTIAAKNGEKYDFKSTGTSDVITAVPFVWLTKGRQFMVQDSKLKLVQNPQTAKWVETYTGQGMPLYWQGGLYGAQKGVELVTGDATSKTLKKTVFKDNDNNVTQSNKPITQ